MSKRSKPSKKKLRNLFSVYLTPAEKVQLRRAAKADGVPVATFIRHAAMLLAAKVVSGRVATADQ
jgi:uncharacterized protein (DUF1778 family)